MQKLPEWPLGTPMIVLDDRNLRWNTATRSLPWMLGGQAVVLIEGIAGGYSCDRLAPGSDVQLKHFRERRIR